MRLFRLSHRRGVTLTEMLVAVGILGLAGAMAKLGLDWVNAISRQRIMLNAQWQAQVALYDVTRNVRNAESIVAISSSTLVLRVLAPKRVQGGYSGTDIFMEENRSTMTFTYVNTGTETFLRRTLESPWGNSESKLLTNMLLPPEGTNFLFHAYPPEDVSPPFDAVDIVFRLFPAYMRSGTDEPIIYRSVSMRRARGQENT